MNPQKSNLHFVCLEKFIPATKCRSLQQCLAILVADGPRYVNCLCRTIGTPRYLEDLHTSSSLSNLGPEPMWRGKGVKAVTSMLCYPLTMYAKQPPYTLKFIESITAKRKIAKKPFILPLFFILFIGIVLYVNFFYAPFVVYIFHLH